jgi:hypothetical protein
MKTIRLLFALSVALVFAPGAFADPTNSIPSGLRKPSFSCDAVTFQTALNLKRAGWTYIMPQPKSPQAAWGNHDGRTTWYVGYWANKDRSTSATQPKSDATGALVGDGKGALNWRRGGSPALPSKIEWLCSKSGGVEPR